MAIETRNVLGGITKSLEGGLEGGIWTGLLGGIVGFSVLPVFVGWAAVLTTLAFGTGMGLGGFLAVAVGAAAITGVVAYRTNVALAKAGAMAGGLIGFARGTEKAQNIENNVGQSTDMTTAKMTDPHSHTVERVQELIRAKDAPHTHIHADQATNEQLLPHAEGLNKTH